METKKIKLHIHALTPTHSPSSAYTLTLSENGPRLLPITIGPHEAQSIALALEHIQPPRPLTHDLLLTCLQVTGYTLREALIHHFHDGIFHTQITLTNGHDTHHIDSRTSDAIALSLRACTPIYTTETILHQHSIQPDPQPQPDPQTSSTHTPQLNTQLRQLTRKELHNLISQAIAKENYELAQLCKNELLRRESENNLQTP
jgi:bifunctional DNase/RNase